MASTSSAASQVCGLVPFAPPAVNRQRANTTNVRGSSRLFQGLLVTLTGLWHAITCCCASRKVKIIRVFFYCFCLTWIPKETEHMQLFFWSVCTSFLSTAPKNFWTLETNFKQCGRGIWDLKGNEFWEVLWKLVFGLRRFLHCRKENLHA